MALKEAYTMMKTNLLKYEAQVKRKPIFPISTILDLYFKLEYVLIDEEEYIMKSLELLLQLVPAPPTSSTCSKSEALPNNSTSC